MAKSAREVLVPRRYLLAAIVSLAPAWAALAGCNDPVAVADTMDNYGATLVVDVLANDRDADGDALDVAVTSNGCIGTTVQVSGGLLRIEPANQAPSTCSIGYRITDTTGRTATSQVNLVAVFLPIFEDGFETGSPGRWSLVCTSSC
jgi:hypothetical protein